MMTTKRLIQQLSIDEAAKMMKHVIDDRYLFMLGGPGLVLKKGKFKPF